MKLTDILLFLSIILIWGGSFTVIKIGLAEISPFLFLALRFFLCALPIAFFLRKPPMKASEIIKLGLFWGVLQFGLLFLALSQHLPPNVAALLMQTQVIWSVIFARLNREPIDRLQLLGTGSIIVGILFLLLPGIFGGSLEKIKLLPVCEVLVAAACWAWSTRIMKRNPTVNALQMISWASLVSVLPLLLMSYFIDGHQKWVTGFSHISFKAMASVLYIALPSTLFAFPTWVALIRRNSAVVASGFFATVPLLSILIASIVLSEKLRWNLFVAGFFVALGIVLNVMKKNISSLREEI